MGINDGYHELGLGKNATFYDGSHQYWEPTIKALDNVWGKHHTLPVPRTNYFTDETNLLATPDMTHAQSNDYLMHWNMDDPEHNRGIMRYTPPWLRQSLGGHDENRHNLVITQRGIEAEDPTILRNHSVPFTGPAEAVGTHEGPGHLYDYMIGDTTTGITINPDDSIDFPKWYSGSEIMNNYRTNSGPHTDWTKENLYDRWMNDPATAHLDIEDPTNRIHHEGVNNPREGFGQYISSVLTDPHYLSVWESPIEEPTPLIPADAPNWKQSKIDKYNSLKNQSYIDQKIHRKYRLDPVEMMARANSQTLGFDNYSTTPHATSGSNYFSSLTDNTERIYANALATYLNYHGN